MRGYLLPKCERPTDALDVPLTRRQAAKVTLEMVDRVASRIAIRGYFPDQDFEVLKRLAAEFAPEIALDKSKTELVEWVVRGRLGLTINVEFEPRYFHCGIPINPGYEEPILEISVLDRVLFHVLNDAPPTESIARRPTVFSTSRPPRMSVQSPPKSDSDQFARRTGPSATMVILAALTSMLVVRRLSLAMKLPESG